jgi:4'-phosphopantetheinyl transferase
MGSEIWSSGDISVWSFDLLDLQADSAFDCSEWLGAEERSRARKFHQAGHRTRYEGAHAVLRWRLAQLSGMGVRDLAFRRGPWGKPALEEPSCPRFSLSYRDALALVATSVDFEVGVDVDSLEGVQDLDGTAVEIMTAQEYCAWSGAPSQARLPALLNCWTRKEAVLKAIGTGLYLDPKCVFVGLCPDLMDLEVCFEGREASLEVSSFAVGARHMGAIAILREWRAEQASTCP